MVRKDRFKVKFGVCGFVAQYQPTPYRLLRNDSNIRNSTVHHSVTVASYFECMKFLLKARLWLLAGSQADIIVVLDLSTVP